MMHHIDVSKKRECSSLIIPTRYKYEMTSAKRGKAIIFNHYTEDEGGPCDVENLKTTLYLHYGFDVIVHNNLLYGEIYDTLTEASKDDYTDFDCLFMTVLTHGNVNGLCAKDRTYSPDELWLPFTLCPSLVGKPKIFLLHACRGTNKDKGISVIQTDSNNSIHLLPTTADILVIYSSFDGYVSYLTDRGSPFISVLCGELRKAAPYEFDFCQLLTVVHNIIAYQCSIILDEGTRKQMPTYSSTLTKLLYLAPKEEHSHEI